MTYLCNIVRKWFYDKLDYLSAKLTSAPPHCAGLGFCALLTLGWPGDLIQSLGWKRMGCEPQEDVVTNQKKDTPIHPRPRMTTHQADLNLPAAGRQEQTATCTHQGLPETTRHK